MNDRKIQAGEKEIVLASEEVQVKNIQMIVQHTSETRKMVLELAARLDAVQNNMIAMQQQYAETTKQLASLQQLFYSKGTVNYNGD